MSRQLVSEKSRQLETTKKSERGTVLPFMTGFNLDIVFRGGGNPDPLESEAKLNLIKSSPHFSPQKTQNTQKEECGTMNENDTIVSLFYTLCAKVTKE